MSEEPISECEKMLDNFLKNRYISLKFKGNIDFLPSYGVDTTSQFYLRALKGCYLEKGNYHGDARESRGSRGI